MERRADLYSSLRIAGIYLLVAALWIAFSDQALARLVADPADLTRWQTVKGWAFVVGSAGLIFWLCYRTLDRTRELRRRFRTAIEAVPDPMALTRLDDGRIEYANRAFRDRFAAEGTEVEGMTSLELGLWADPSDRREFKERLEREGRVVNQKAFHEKATRCQGSDSSVCFVKKGQCE